MTIQIRDLCKEYNGQPVLSHLNLNLEEGCCNVLMGPSGCGKTTLLHILMGLVSPDSGTVQTDEKMTRGSQPAHKGILEFRKKSAVFQEDRLCEQFSVLANIRLVTGKSVSVARIDQHLSAVGLPDILHQPVCELSGGMKRRVAIVRAMLAPSDLLLLDEPFKGLDTATRTEVMDYFKTFSKGKTSLLVTHEQAEADYLQAITLTPWGA